MLPHICDDRCVCPRCGKGLYFSTHYDDHACVDPVCRWQESKDGRLIGARIPVLTISGRWPSQPAVYFLSRDGVVRIPKD